MAIKMMTSRDFNQDASGAKREAVNGPVFITARGETTHVLLSIEEYRKLTGGETSIVDLLVMPDSSEIDFEPEAVQIKVKPAEF